MPKRDRGIIVEDLVAACVVHELRPDAGSVGVTAIDKRPVSGPGPRASGLDVSGARVGERWMIGPTVIVEAPPRAHPAPPSRAGSVARMNGVG